MAVETGTVEFGPKQKYGLLTKADSSRLLRMAIMGAIAHPSEAYATRQLVRRMMNIIGQADLVMLADLAETACHKDWDQLAEELKAKAGI